MLKHIRPITLAAAVLALSVLGGTGMAVANAADSSSNNPNASQVQTTEGTGGAESAADQAAQDAAVKAAGIDPSASNINYDDETGVASLDSGDDGETND